MLRIDYLLHPLPESKKRTLWDYLVAGKRDTSPLDVSNPEVYSRVTKPDEMKDACTFRYVGDRARITITKPNSLSVEADTEEHLSDAAGRIVTICAERGVPLCFAEHHRTSRFPFDSSV